MPGCIPRVRCWWPTWLGRNGMRRFPVRIVSFNVENFFQRPKAMNQATWAEGRPVLAAHAELNALLEEAIYTPVMKARMVELLAALGLTRSDSASSSTMRAFITGV